MRTLVFLLITGDFLSRVITKQRELNACENEQLAIVVADSGILTTLSGWEEMQVIAHEG